MYVNRGSEKKRKKTTEKRKANDREKMRKNEIKEENTEISL